MTRIEKLKADLMLLKKIDRNLMAMNGEVAVRFGRAVRRHILNLYGCETSRECQAKIVREMEKCA